MQIPAIQYIKDSVDFAVKVGAPYIIVVPSPVGRVALPEGYTYDEMWENAKKKSEKLLQIMLHLKM